MNIHPCFILRNIILAAVLTIGFASSALAQYQTHGFFVDLNTKEVAAVGDYGGGPFGINDAGQLVGQNGGLYHAFITGPKGVGITDLGTFGGDNSLARGINGVGQVVGWSNTDKPFIDHAFITGPNGVGIRDLGTLGGDYSDAHGINDAGQVVGESYTANGQSHAFITGPNGVGIRDLGIEASVAYGINDAGQVVGANGNGHAFVTGPNGVGMTDLGTLGGNFSAAYGINDAGQVVGYSYTANGQQHAFITGPDGAGMTDLGTLGGNFSVAYGINDAGQVVGETGADIGLGHAFITGPNGVGMTDLNFLVNPPSGFTFDSATAINNHGQVAAEGLAGIIPEPEMYAMLLSGLGLIGFLARRRAAA